ncbi:Site-specific recombinase XerD [Sphingomonas palmae]|uniref:Site-specific recombinase XerD n=1 Tax=Sphingomonas palmae TaxID=1855283 RepID=A0A1H7U8S0_9SPHN|nr:site-specific integrase [Sphingomonas palmae]SEL93229.1 Site-specific recombinase XerD [Sphingomonas palmae]
MPTVKLTKKYIESIVPTDRVIEYVDAYCPGLRLTSRPTGTLTFVARLRINGKAKKYTLGQFPRHSLEEAREWAMNIGRNRDLGIDVIEESRIQEQAEQKRRERDCDWMFEQYMLHEGASRRSAAEKRRLYRRDISPVIGGRSYFDISHNDLAHILQSKLLTAPSISNGLQSLIRRWFRWAVTKGRHITELTCDPSVDLTKLHELQSRGRVLSDHEIALFFQALDERNSPFNEPLLLALHTGVRRGEAFGMRWSELDMNRGDWLIPKHRTKTNVELLLPLPAIMTDMLELAASRRRKGVELVWPSQSNPANAMSGFSKITKTLNEAMSTAAAQVGIDVEPWSIHDLRRTLATGMYGLLDENDQPLIPPHVVERVVNHKLPGVQGVYNRHAYYAEKRAALRIWAAHLARLRM